MEKTSNFKVVILGNSAAIPTKSSHLSSQVLILNNNYFLIDCGEGTQIQLIKNKIKYHKIDNIFISHLHGDHFFGLIGLISTYHLLGRSKPLIIYCPAELENIIRLQLKVAHTELKYELIFHSLLSDKSTIILEDDTLTVHSFPLVHRVPTWGFRFNQKQNKKKIKKSFVSKYSPSIREIKSIKNGDDFVDDLGNKIPNKTITIEPPSPVSYAYCSDTRYDSSLIDYVKNVSMLYHEATFDNSMQELAIQKFHSTARDAATLAKKAKVSQLLLGHFSARNNDHKILLNEAEEVFPSTQISEEGNEYHITKI